MPIIGGRTASVRGLGFQGAGNPNQVTGLTATDFGTGRAYNNGRIDLAWTTPANNGAPITGYFIERSTNSGSTWSTLVANTGTTAVSYSDTSLSSATRYDYRVSAINAAGTGLASTAANATATTVPQAPTIGTATVPEVTQAIDVAYTANATGGKTVTTFTATSSPGSLTATGSSPIRVTGLTNGTAYTFTVTATNANGTSAASSASNSATPVAPFIATGGTIVTSGGYKYHTFTSNGTFAVSSGSKNVEYLIIAGGGSGGMGSTPGGGGAGGVLNGTVNSVSSGNYAVVIGSGANGAPFNLFSPFANAGSKGNDSTLTIGSTYTATGGGAGGAASSSGGSGGSGGGSSWGGVNSGGGNVAGQGNKGGINSNGGGGGGGGAGATGGNSAGSGGAGGIGTNTYSTWLTATSTGVSGYIAGGGGGGGQTTTGGGSGGTGGGSSGTQANFSIAGNGTANTGGGSGGTGSNTENATGGAGGSGLVIVRYTV